MQLDKEVQKIKDSLSGRGLLTNQFQILQRWETSPTDVRRAILQEKPEIVHFSGHGQGQAGLVLVDDRGQPKLVGADALADLFQFVADNVKCVLLNACYAEFQANAIVKHINYVIGMQQEVWDITAIAFAVGFYDGIGNGYSIEESFEIGRNAIRLEISDSASTGRKLGSSDRVKIEQTKSIPQHLIPILKRKIDLSDDELISSCGVDYKQLRHLLTLKKWQEADEETYKLILSISHQMRFEEIACLDLQTIDKLWIRYSEGHFGLSIQAKIWQQAKNQTNSWQKFCEQVGWLHKQKQGSLLLNWFNRPTEIELLVLRENIHNQPLSSFSLGYLPLLAKNISAIYKDSSSEREKRLQIFFNRLQECRL
ncbi:MAG: GUN4 domain-containing protein [Nostoc sp.]|uniref:GUN4 domain-containing protein n=1 Tax=Nostoc sp. TaxID=1180 RepID=UPI002FF74375